MTAYKYRIADLQRMADEAKVSDLPGLGRGLPRSPAVGSRGRWTEMAECCT